MPTFAQQVGDYFNAAAKIHWPGGMLPDAWRQPPPDFLVAQGGSVQIYPGTPDPTADTFAAWIADAYDEMLPYANADDTGPVGWTDNNGDFTAPLPAGDYWIDVYLNGTATPEQGAALVAWAQAVFATLDPRYRDGTPVPAVIDASTRAWSDGYDPRTGVDYS
jgi:hypothetical protein